MNENEQENTGAAKPEEIGRIEVVPEILVSIAQRSALRTKGVAQLAEIPTAVARRHSRKMRHDGILLDLTNGTATFDLYVIMDANSNIMEASRSLQASIVEGIDTMVGIPVNAVNIHVEDVQYPEPSS